MTYNRSTEAYKEVTQKLSLNIALLWLFLHMQSHKKVILPKTKWEKLSFLTLLYLSPHLIVSSEEELSKKVNFCHFMWF